MDWFEREANILDEQLERGEISNNEYRESMRDLNNQLRDEATEAAMNAYDDVMGRY